MPEPYSPALRLPLLSRSWASREANALGTRIIIAELLEAHRERLNELIEPPTDVIEDAFDGMEIQTYLHVTFRTRCYAT